MGRQESFNTNTQSITHDSDPRKLRFEQISDTGIVDLGTVLDMALMAMPADIAPTEGPDVGDLTDGSGAASNPVTFRHLNAGSTTITITSDGGTGILTFTLTSATIKALAIAQGVADVFNANIDFTAYIDSTFGAGALATDFGVKGFGTGVPTANLQHGPGSITFTGDNGTISAMSCDVSLTDGASAPQTVGSGGFLIDSGGSSTGSAFTANANPSLILGFNIASTGTAVNHLDLTLTPPSVADATAGEMTAGSSHWVLTFTDASTMDVIVSQADFLALCTSQGLLGNTTGSLDLTVFADFSSVYGKTIDSVAFNTTITWLTSNSRGLNYTTTTFQLFEQAANLDSSLHLQTGDGGSNGPGMGIVIVNGDVLRLTFNLVSNPNASPVVVTITLDATSILSGASGPQLAAQHSRIIQSFDFSPYFGWTVTFGALFYTYGYGPGTAVPPSELVVIFNTLSGQTSFGPVQGINVAPVGNFSVGLSYPLGPAMFDVEVDVNMFPLDTPAGEQAIVLTEAYEIRNRNQAAIRFVVTPAPGYDTEAVWTFVARSYVSQGESNGKIYWTPAPVSIFDESAASTPGNGVIIDAVNHRTGMPANYGGTIITLPTNTGFVGPWNYWKILLQPITVFIGSPPDFTGWKLEAYANAREI
jgi:hypothetical protein